MTHPVILDCDPGVDDCIALLVALGAADRIDLKSICVVAGNVPVEVCAKNGLGILALAGRKDVPVYSGCDRPLRVEPSFADVTPGSGEVAPNVELDERARCSHEEAWKSAQQRGHARHTPRAATV